MTNFSERSPQDSARVYRTSGGFPNGSPVAYPQVIEGQREGASALLGKVLGISHGGHDSKPGYKPS